MMTRLFIGLAIAGCLALAPAQAAVANSAVAVTVSGSMVSGGGLDPIGDGRFRVTSREYAGRVAGEDLTGCFRGFARVVEHATLSVPHYAGSHHGTISIASDAGTLLLEYRGSVDRMAGRGEWWVVRSSGTCADATGSGTYNSVFRAEAEPEYRLELRGTLLPSD